MSAAKHTPGPWVLAIGRYILCRDGQSQIAVMDKSDDWEDEQEANGRLIAASPKLFEVLKSAPLELHPPNPNDEGRICICSHCAFARAARAVIADVEGRAES